MGKAVAHTVTRFFPMWRALDRSVCLRPRAHCELSANGRYRVALSPDFPLECARVCVCWSYAIACACVQDNFVGLTVVYRRCVTLARELICSP